MIQSEFSRPQRLDTIGAGENQVHVEAEPGERTLLAERFGLKAIDSLKAEYAIHRDARGIIATGHLSARVVQACVITDDPVPATIEEDFAIRFLPEGDGDTGEEDVELGEEDCDIVFYSGGAIDLGEAAAESLALALDPYPRSPRAEAALRDAGVISEEEAKRQAEESGPFGGLAGLRDKLGKE
ncbi:YceD family protein [Sphingomonas sp. HITSZ_GF]|uniref:YceD family protein n=1 Tax=Sphingomonas sp. HITSZ_GF TaxID=3037247 RepID=UPI00240D7BE9|nr:YceD family protein [Sphingomonas sp. HITSZ_GF]MDG2534377.1 YceD family protein [Sphingomonas sp. HITSZ_GF]